MDSDRIAFDAHPGHERRVPGLSAESIAKSTMAVLYSPAGRVSLCLSVWLLRCSNIPLNGQPKSDFHQGFIHGYVNGETARLNTPPGPCPPRGWGWIPRGELISHTPAYAAGYQDGIQSVPSLREVANESSPTFAPRL